MNKTTLLISATAVVAATAGAGGWWVLQPRTDPFAQCSTSSVAGASIGGPFTLVDETGATVTDADVLTKPTLLYFGYTFCPDVCPTDSARNAEAVELLAERGYDTQAVFITIDPERDDVDRMREFTDYFHPGMIGLTGNAEQVAAASRAYKTFYKKQETGDEYYLIDHSTFTYLVLPELGFVQFFRREDTPQGMADTVACYIKAAG
ncbi:MAG: SCO family protein [Paracoccaceae bacterium]